MYQKTKKKIRDYKSRFVRKAQYVKGDIQGNLINTYWFDKVPNFGDLLNPLLLKYYGLTPIRVTREYAEALVIGSNLDKQSEDFSGYIVGAGLKYDSHKKFPNAKILAVRGELTRERIGAYDETALGDPGLLVTKIYKKHTPKKYVLGIVPHFMDKNDVRLINLFSSNKQNILLIDVQKKPKHVISDIDQCEFILSSSLHGLVTAESLGIPNGWIILSNKVQGNNFKFFDYASAIGIDIQPFFISGYESLLELTEVTHKVADNISEVKDKLDVVFKEFTKDVLLRNMDQKKQK